MTPEIWAGRRVLLTGHTGFKGVWAGLMLRRMGAEVTGFSLAPDTDPALHNMVGTGHLAGSVIADLGDRDALRDCISAARPQAVLHMAAQPLVRRSYRAPVETFATNVMGTVHLLDALREAVDLQAALVVTTDKVYANAEDGRAFVESDPLGGHDPYAASKAACEIAVRSFALSYFDLRSVPVMTARGGNVIGGGDFSEDRLIPDIVRAQGAEAAPMLRNPDATRPWQHVLDCLSGYFAYLERALRGDQVPHALNFGPHDPTDVMTVAQVQAAFTDGASWQLDGSAAEHEMATLAIDAGLADRVLGWRGVMRSGQAVGLTAQWYRAWRAGQDPLALTQGQIADYFDKKVLKK
ncbi:CDP-glucose 4,6-dehydratase [Monaibacterium marinum]|uniref:CDP-glucose 4,6-dehydratase n=1 Tax=Pontivivens marinum TaxID=1690039 RepID=A0A2C9CVS4_9RHOB|nr:CDP-glucose 4,6-dehydratase [Monaibacterium marinum]SOH95591.1 CDP-glucose 4,6-dehydratase [Monaibacterium marinum]